MNLEHYLLQKRLYLEEMFLLLVLVFQNYNQLLLLLQSLKTSDQPHDHFWKNISALDQIRGTDFKTLNPEWSKLIL